VVIKQVGHGVEPAQGEEVRGISMRTTSGGWYSSASSASSSSGSATGTGLGLGDREWEGENALARARAANVSKRTGL